MATASFELYHNRFMHNKVRENSVQQVVRRPDDFVENSYIDVFVNSLSTTREWADNSAVQATADALGITIEIINTNQH